MKISFCRCNNYTQRTLYPCFHVYSNIQSQQSVGRVVSIAREALILTWYGHVILFSFLLDWRRGCRSSLGKELQVGTGFLAADWPLAGCTSGSWLLPQIPSQELQRSQTGKYIRGGVLHCYCT